MTTFFIAGEQRSGTTLLSSVLGKHPEISIDVNSVGFRIVTCFGNYKEVLPYNLDHSPQEIQAWLIKNDYKGRLAELIDPEEVVKYGGARKVLQRGIQKRLEKEGKSVFGDKVPEMEHYAAELLMLIPNAKFIHLVRDGRAVAQSKWSRAKKNIKVAAQEWVDGNIIGLSNQYLVGEHQYKIVRYEDLLLNPETTCKEICTFLGVEFNANMVAENVLQTKENDYVKSTFNTSKIDAFKQQLTKGQLQQIEEIQGVLLKKFGYELIVNKSLQYKPLSIFTKLRLRQAEHLKQLFIGKREGMREHQLVEVNIPFKTRLRNYFFMSAYDVLNKKLFRRIFRKRWIKNVHMNKKSFQN